PVASPQKPQEANQGNPGAQRRPQRLLPGLRVVFAARTSPPVPCAAQFGLPKPLVSTLRPPLSPALVLVAYRPWQRPKPRTPADSRLPGPPPPLQAQLRAPRVPLLAQVVYTCRPDHPRPNP